MSFCDKSNCGYYYIAQGEMYARCHCPEDMTAPCEYDDEPTEYEDEYEREDPNYEMGFDPYMGCYTDDC